MYTEMSEDDPAFADFARNGRLLSFHSIFGPSHAYYANTYFFGMIPGFIKVLRWQIDLLGPGLWQIRLGNLLAALLAVTLLFHLIRRWKLPALAEIGLFLFSISHLFWMVTHICRPEGFVLLFLVFNSCGCFSGPGAWRPSSPGWPRQRLSYFTRRVPSADCLNSGFSPGGFPTPLPRVR